MAKDVKFNIKLTVDGKAQVVQAVTSTKELQAAVDGAKSSTANFASTLIRLNQTVEVFDNAADALSKLQGALKGLSEGAANAEVANTKLATVMMQRMNASDEDVAAIKKLVAEQKELEMAFVGKNRRHCPTSIALRVFIVGTSKKGGKRQ